MTKKRMVGMVVVEEEEEEGEGLLLTNDVEVLNIKM